MARSSSKTLTVVIDGQRSPYAVHLLLNGQREERIFPWSLTAHQLQTIQHLQDAHQYVSSEDLQHLGRDLYEKLLADSALYSQNASQNITQVRLQVKTPDLLSMPWEALSDGQQLLTAQGTAPFVRTLHDEASVRQIQIQGPLRILFAAASPSDQPHLQIAKAAQELEGLMGEAIRKKRIVFDVVLNITREELHDCLQRQYHILYFAGHGTSGDISLDDGSWLRDSAKKERKSGDSLPLTAPDLAAMLEGKETRLVFLAACNTAASPVYVDEVLNDFARTLGSLAKVPAIVAMQYPISNLSANQLTTRFFQALANFQPVDVALAEARKALIIDGQISRDVIAPVMYLQAASSHLFARAPNWPARIATSLLLLVILIGTSVFWVANRVNTDQDLVNRSQALISHVNERQDSPDAALLLSAAAYQMMHSLKACQGNLDSLWCSLRVSLGLEPDEMPSKAALFKTLAQIDPRLYRVLPRQSGNVYAVALSKDNHLAAYGASDGTIWIYDTTSGQEWKHIKPDAEVVTSLAFSSDQQWIAAGFDKGVVRVYDLTSLQVVAELVGPNPLEGFWHVEFNPDSQILAASTCEDLVTSGDKIGFCTVGHVELWDTKTWTPRKPLRSHPQETTLGVDSIAFSSDGKFFASGAGKTVVIWDLASGKTQKKLEVNYQSVSSLKFSPDDQTLIVGSSTAEVSAWDIQSGLLSTAQTQLGGPVDQIVFSDDQIKLIVREEDGTVSIRRMADGQVDSLPLQGHTAKASLVTSSPDGSTLASMSETQFLLWDLRTRSGFQHQLPIFDGSGIDVAFSSEGNLVTSVSSDSTGYIWDLAQSTETRIDLPEPVSYVAQHNTLLAYINASRDRAVLYDTSTAQAIGKPFSYPSQMVALAFSPTGDQLAVGTQDQHVYLLDTITGQPQDLPDWHEGAVRSLVYSPDGRLLASGARDLRVWDVQTKALFSKPLVFDSQIWAMAFNPDGTLLAVSEMTKGLVTFVNPQTMQIERTLETDLRSVRSLAFSSDGQFFITGGFDGTIKLWDSLTGVFLGEIPKTYPYQVQRLAVDHQGYWVASLACAEQTNSACTKSQVILWKVSLAAWIEQACEIANRDVTQDEIDLYKLQSKVCQG